MLETPRYVPIHEERLLGLLRSERLASEMSAVTRVIVILEETLMGLVTDKGRNS